MAMRYLDPVIDYENSRPVFLSHSLFTFPFITVAPHVRFPFMAVSYKIDMQPTPFWLKPFCTEKGVAPLWHLSGAGGAT